jgi:hypothetical protein
MGIEPSHGADDYVGFDPPRVVGKLERVPWGFEPAGIEIHAYARHDPDLPRGRGATDDCLDFEIEVREPIAGPRPSFVLFYEGKGVRRRELVFLGTREATAGTRVRW